MRRALITLTAVLLGGSCVVGCAETSRAERPEPPATSAAPSGPTRLVRGMAVPDQGVFPDCLGRFGEGSSADPIDPAKPLKLPPSPELALEKYFAEQRGRTRPEAPLYVPRNFERHDPTTYGGSTHPDDLARHSRWIGYRPDDGSVFAVVLLDAVGSAGGWRVVGDEGCSARSPADRTATPSPTPS